MVSLIIDCSYGMNVYLLDNDKVFSKIDSNQKKHTDELLLSIDEMLIEANLKISDIENIGICVGPGSFTGIRVAISVCKGLAVGTNTKVFVATNFDVVEDKNKKNAIYILEGFSKYVYIRIVENGVCIKDECVLIDDLQTYLSKSNSKFDIIIQNEKVQKLLNLNKKDIIIAQNNTILHFLTKFNKNDNIEINKIAPVYLRASQAEIERENKLAGVK